MGEKEAVLASLNEEMKAIAWDDADLPLLMSGFFAYLNLPDETVEWMGRALERGLTNYPFFAEIGPFDTVRNDERFQSLLAEIKRQWEDSEIPVLVPEILG